MHIRMKAIRTPLLVTSLAAAGASAVPALALTNPSGRVGYQGVTTQKGCGTRCKVKLLVDDTGTIEAHFSAFFYCTRGRTTFRDWKSPTNIPVIGIRPNAAGDFKYRKSLGFNGPGDDLVTVKGHIDANSARGTLKDENAQFNTSKIVHQPQTRADARSLHCGTPTIHWSAKVETP